MIADGWHTRAALRRAWRARRGRPPAKSTPRPDYWNLDPETASGPTIEKCRDFTKVCIENGLKHAALERVLDKRFPRSLYQPILAQLRQTWRPTPPSPASKS